MEPIFVQGRWLSSEQLDGLRQLIAAHPDWSRFRLSVHLAEQWNWRNGVGQLKDMAARTLLLKLERRGLLRLPPRRPAGGRRAAGPPSAPAPALLPQPLCQDKLAQLLPVSLTLVQSPEQRLQLRQWLQYHYLGYQRAVGENVQYLAQDGRGRPLACLVFGAAAWKCAPRDQFIGWSDSTRASHLALLANNMRFLILPWLQVKHLASHLLSLACRRLGADWQSKYGHPIYLLESFVQRDRFQGACYRAANWICVGETQSRSRNDRYRCLRVPAKDIYLYPLCRSFRSRLQSEAPHP